MQKEDINNLIANYSIPDSLYEFSKKISFFSSISSYAEYINYIAKLKKPLKILEIGPAVGLFIDFMNKNFKHISIEGVEINKNLVSATKKENLNVKQGNLLKLSSLYKKEVFDMVIACNFFHNDLPKFKTKKLFLDWMEEILEQVYFVLKPGGIFLFDTEIKMDKKQFIRKGFSIKKAKTNAEKNKIFFSLVKPNPKHIKEKQSNN